MANREISQFASLAAGSQSPTMILPIVDTSLGHVAAANKQVTLNALFFDLGLNTSDGAVSMTGLLAAPSASSAGKLKWYYNNSTKQWLASIDTGSYYSVQRSIAAGLTAGWLPYVDTGGILNGSANATLDGNGSLFCKFVTIQSALAGLNSVAEINDSTGTDRWEIRLGASNQLIIQDFQNSKDVITLTPGATPVVQLNGTLRWSADNSQDIGLINSGRARTAYIGTSVIIGRSSNTTGVLQFNNSTNTNTTSFQAGAAAASRTYTWPTDFGAAGSVLTDAAGNGTLSWAVPAGTIGGSIAVNQVAFGSAANVISGNNNFQYDATNTTLTIENSAAAGDGIFKLGQSGIVDWSLKNQKTTANFLIASSSTGTAFRIDSATGFISTSNNTATAKFNVNGFSSTTIGQIIKLAAAQTADALQVQDSSSNVLTSFSSAGNLDFGSGILARWSSTSVSGGSKDLGLARNAAGILEVNNGTAGTYRDLRVRYLGVGAPPSSSNPFYAYTNDSSLSGTSILAKFEQLGTVTKNQTSYQIAIYGSINIQAISAGITDSGYRRGFQLDMFLNTSSFAGTLQEQTGGYVNAGIYTATAGAVLNSSYGYRVVGHNNTASTTVSLLYGFHSNLVGATAGTVTTRHNFFVPDSVVANGTGQSGLTIGVLSGATNNTHLLLGTTTIPSGNFAIYNASTNVNYLAGILRVQLTSTVGVLSIGGASSSGAYIGVSTSSQAANDKLISVAMAGSITGLLYAADISMTATTGVLTRITNTENATNTSNCELRLVTGGASGGDPFIHFNISGNTDWSIGARNTDSDNLTITAASDLSTSVILKVTTAGAFTVIDGSTWNVGTTTGLKLGTSGGASGQKLGFFNATPIVQPLLATGAGATVDNVITVLQNLGLCRQT